MNPAIQITDVTLRDGLQAETQTISTPNKLKLFSALAECRFSRLEITSFVHPKWIPQLADSEALCKAIFSDKKNETLSTMAFVPNEKGLERLLAFPIPWVSAFVAASETFNQKNVNSSIDDTLKNLKQVVDRAKKEQRKVRIYLSTAWGCPYEKEISEAVVLNRVKQIHELGADEIALSDTIGVAAPSRVDSLCRATLAIFKEVAVHFHHTYGLAIANASAALKAGVTQFDGSLGGVGGCPYALGATGNVPTEDLLYLFQREKRAVVPWEAIQKSYLVLQKDLGLQPQSRLFELSQKGGTPYGVQ